MATFNNKINLINNKNINLKLIHSSWVVNSDRNTVFIFTLVPFPGVDGTNEAIVKAYNLKWDMVLNVTVPNGVHAAPVAVNLISYSVMGSIGEVKGYMKYVHNRPYQLDLTHEQFIRESNLRNRNLAIFSLMAAPSLRIFL